MKEVSIMQQNVRPAPTVITLMVIISIFLYAMLFTAYAVCVYFGVDGIIWETIGH